MKLSNEAKVGLMVTLSVVLLAILTFKTGNMNFSVKGYELRVQFENVDGISTNSPVMFNGLEVGRVKDIVVRDDHNGARMEVVVWIRDGVRLRKGARAYVKNMGFMGEKYVGLKAGRAGEEYLSPDALIIGQEPADLDRVLREGQEIVKEVKSISASINQRLTKNAEAIDRVFVNLDASLANAAEISENLNDRFKANRDHIDDIMANLRSSSENLDLFTYDLMQNPWKLMYRPKDQRARHEKELEGMK
jgi:phospholipid/cholesterol/gamma-HCH transport system substrate-binding protein